MPTAVTARPPILVLTEPEIRECVTLGPDLIDVIEDAFTRLASGRATVPPILGVEIPEQQGEVDVKAAYVHGLDHFAVKIASGFYSNTARGLPTSSGLMVVISTANGFPEAVLLDNGYLTTVRTAVAGAIAAKYLAPARVGTVGVVGAGLQGRYQVRALQMVRSFDRVIVYDTSSQAVADYVSEMRALLDKDVTSAPDLASMVQRADVVICSTPSRQPYLRAEWLHPGLHITAMGADGPDKGELYPEVLARADRVVCDLKSQCFVRGELHHAHDAGLIAPERVDELGELTSGRKRGRRSDSEITVCDLTGVGVQDTAIALVARRKALERQLGVSLGGPARS